jgi:quercetin dioxygenase-like cupin family protein
MKKSFFAFGLALILTFVFINGAFAEPDQFEVGPNIYHQIFENERARVSEITFQPGDQIGMHTHAYDHFVYVLEAGQLTLTHPDGTSSVVDGAVGQVMWLPIETHSAVNTGATKFRALVVELK